MSKTIIIGDIHGCLDELFQLLAKVGYLPKDQVYLVGDMTEKGPWGPKVVHMARTLGWRSVLGNHEEMLLRCIKHEERVAQGLQEKNPMKRAAELQETIAKLDQDDIEWLKQLPWALEIPGGHTLVHGGITPLMDKLPTPEALETMSSKKKKKAKHILRTRYVDNRGHMVSLGEETKHDKFWAEVYDGRFGLIFFGHQPWMKDGPPHFGEAIGLDLGCVHGGHLCAFVIHEDTSGTTYTVPALKEYSPPLYPQPK